MKELVICSGKGGTGKTSVSAAFAALAENAVLVDCDVDAADLHLVLGPEILERHEYSGGRVASIDPERCDACGRCFELCRFDSIVREDGEDGFTFSVDALAARVRSLRSLLPLQRHRFPGRRPRRMVPVHVPPRFPGPRPSPPGRENSGKLVSRVRQEAAAVAESEGRRCCWWTALRASAVP